MRSSPASPSPWPAARRRRLVTLARGEDVLDGARAAGSLLLWRETPHAAAAGRRRARPPRAVARLGARARRGLPRGREPPGGVLGGLAIAALDLGVVGRRIAARSARCRRRRQWADHVAYGLTVGAVLRRGALTPADPMPAADRGPLDRRGRRHEAEADRGVRRPREHRRGARERCAHALARRAGSSPASAGLRRVDARARRLPAGGARAAARSTCAPARPCWCAPASGCATRRPRSGGAEYVAVCLPAFAPDTVHRDDEA